MTKTIFTIVMAIIALLIFWPALSLFQQVAAEPSLLTTKALAGSLAGSVFTFSGLTIVYVWFTERKNFK